MLRKLWDAVKARARTWAVGLALATLSLGGLVAWRIRASRVRRAAKVSGELGRRIEEASRGREPVTLTEEDTRAVQEAWSREVEERVRDIRAQAEASRKAIRQKFGPSKGGRK